MYGIAGTVRFAGQTIAAEKSQSKDATHYAPEQRFQRPYVSDGSDIGLPNGR